MNRSDGEVSQDSSLLTQAANLLADEAQRYELGPHRAKLYQCVDQLRARATCLMAACLHCATMRGADIPLRYGSHQSEVCLACGMFRPVSHAGRSPCGDWRPASEFVHATAPQGDDE